MARVHIGESIEGYENAMTAHWQLYAIAFVLLFGGIFFWWILHFSITFNAGTFLIIAGIILFLIARKIGRRRKGTYRL